MVFDDFRRKAERLVLVEHGLRHRPEAMPGDLRLGVVTHPLECRIDRRLR